MKKKSIKAEWGLGAIGYIYKIKNYTVNMV